MYFIRRQLEHRMPAMLPHLHSFAESIASTSAEKQRVSQSKKFSKLMERGKTKHETDTTRFVINLSSRKLSSCETKVLAKGHGFNMTTMRPPLPKMVAALEDGIAHLNPSDRERVRQKVIGILSNIPQHQRHNLQREEGSALRALHDDEKIVLLPADKGNSTGLTRM